MIACASATKGRRRARSVHAKCFLDAAARVLYEESMSLALIGANASYEFRWRRWALLRDVVATHLEGENVGSRYPQFASIGRALGMESVRIPAKVLAAELREIGEALAKHPVTDLVLGPITAQVLYPALALERSRPLTRTELAHVAPIGDETTLDRYFASMLNSMLDVCASPGDGDEIEVLDG